MPVLVYVENSGGSFKKAVFELLTYAKAVAGKINTSLIALSAGNAEEKEMIALGAFGVEKVLSVPGEQFKSFNNQSVAELIKQAADKESAGIVILPNTFNGKAIAPALALKLEAGLVSGAVDLPEIENEKFFIKKAVFSGKALARVEILTKNKVITLSPNSYFIRETGGSASIEIFEPQLPESSSAVEVQETLLVTDKVALPEAEIVVSGGRGLKGAENWHLIEELADALGGATACSKPVSDAGWRPHEEHVGQTGISISPNLYVAVGISGAIQHLAGVNSSKTILVINKDEEAPFFKVADYGIVGDAFEVVPKLIEAIKEFKEKG